MHPTRFKTKLILGPPGTGKTYRLLNILEELLETYKPEEVCFITFTRKGAQEAKNRAMEKFKFTDEQIPYFRTFHSLAFHVLNMEPRQVMGWTNYLDICRHLGITITSLKVSMDDGTPFQVANTKGDRLFFMENFARSTKKELEEVFRIFINDDLDFRELELLRTTLRQYKKVQNKVDFTDMISMFIEEKPKLPIKVLIIDEGQDLSTLQWEMAKYLMEQVEKIFIAGDDDQAIYSWAGADVEEFLRIEAEDIEVLRHSYRIPIKVHKLAEKHINRVKHRNQKDYFPTEFIGSATLHDELNTINMEDGTWLLLARNIFLLPEYCHYCIEKGFLFESKYGSIIDVDLGNAIKGWEALRRGEEISAAWCKQIYGYIGQTTGVVWGKKKLLKALPDDTLLNLTQLQDDFGLKTVDIWHQALDMAKQSDIDYYLSSLKRGEKLQKEPRIKINTIHGVKGGEADNVVMMVDMSKRSYDEWMRNPDNEIRVWYVGFTRTKSNLFLLNPRTQYFYEI